MTKVELTFDRNGKNYYTNQKSSLTRRVVISLSFLALFVFTPTNSFSQVSSSGHLESTVYKFTVSDVTDPSHANGVQSLLMSNDFISSCTFVDEADCFKLTSSKPLTYETLRDALLSEGFILSEKVLLSDGTIIKSKESEINQTH